MKKVFGLLLLAGLLLAAMATAALAASPGDGIRDFADSGSQSGNGYAWGFVDADNDRVNDNFIDVNDDGVCDNFVDANSDGVNDLRGTLGEGGHGPHGANRTGDCDGDNFIDNDDDGVCDLSGTGGQKRIGGNGQGRSQ